MVTSARANSRRSPRRAALSVVPRSSDASGPTGAGPVLDFGRDFVLWLQPLRLKMAQHEQILAELRTIFRERCATYLHAQGIDPEALDVDVRWASPDRLTYQVIGPSPDQGVAGGE